MYGRYWARTSDPQLVDWGSRSRPFAQVRSNSMVERNRSRDRTLERTRTNANPCHSCHAHQPSRLVLVSKLLLNSPERLTTRIYATRVTNGADRTLPSGELRESFLRRGCTPCFGSLSELQTDRANEMR